MSEFDEKLNKILSSPEEMEKIAELARSFSEGTKSGGENKKNGRNESHSMPDPRLISAMSRIMGSYSGFESGKEELLGSIKPYLGAKRRETIDKALEITRLAKLAKLAITELSEEDKNV